MKKILIIVVFLLFGVTNLVFAGQFGPFASSGNDLAAFNLGLGYMLHQADLKGKGGFQDMELQQNQAFVQAGLGLGKYWEVFVRGGGSTLDVDDAFRIHRQSDFNGNFALYGSGGLRGLVYSGKSFDVGVFAEGSYYSNYDDSTTESANLGFGSEPVKEKVHFDNMYDINGGLVLQLQIEGAYLYFGPVFYYSEVDVTSNATGQDSALTDSTKETLKEENHAGAFIGFHWPLRNGVNVSLEGQYKSSFSFGGTISKAF